MSEEHEEFARRLSAAMRRAGYEARPSVLHKVFNSQYHGASVTFQTASRWLRGVAMPEQDKLQVLAAAFHVSPQALRFGEDGGVRVAEPRGSWPVAVGVSERNAIDTFLSLPPARRQLVGQLIKALAED